MSYYDTPEPVNQDSEDFKYDQNHYFGVDNEIDLHLEFNEFDKCISAKCYLDLEFTETRFILGGKQCWLHLQQVKDLQFSEHFKCKTKTGIEYLNEISQPFNKQFESLDSLSDHFGMLLNRIG